MILASGLDSRAYRLRVARGDDGLRDRPARGHRVQDQDAGRTWRRTDRQAPHGRDGPALRLAVGTDRRGLRPEPADGVERRGPARLPAARGTGPPARHHHRAQRARQPGRAWKACRTSTLPITRRRSSACRTPPSGGATTASTSTSPNWSTSATATRPPAYLGDHGWQLDAAQRQGTVRRQRPAADRRERRGRQLRRAAVRQRRAQGGADDEPDRRRQLGSGVQRRGDGHDGRRSAGAGQPGADPLIDDPFAAPLVRAVGIDFFTRLVDGEIALADAGAATARDSWPTVIAVRTRFFDDFFVDAGAAGIRQAVILASGLDSRAYRLPWPAGTVVYEIDQPKVIEFKTATMTAIGATPTAERRTVSIDLREDWPAALRAQRIRRVAADGVERRGAAGLSAAGGAGPAVRQHHRAQRAGQPTGHRVPPRRRRQPSANARRR